MLAVVSSKKRSSGIEETRETQIALARLDFFLADARESVLVESQETSYNKITGLLSLANLLIGQVGTAHLSRVRSVRDEANMLMGRACLRHGALDEARMAYQDVYKAGHIRGCPPEELAEPLLGLVEVAMKQQDLLEAKKCLAMAKELNLVDGEVAWASALLLWEGELALAMTNLKDAHNALEESLKGMQKAKINVANGILQVKLFSALSRISTEFKDPTRARRWLLHGFQWLEKVTTSAQMVSPFSRLALWHEAQLLVDLAEGQEKAQREREVALALAEVLYIKGRWEQSLDWAKKGEDALLFDHAHARAMLAKSRALGSMRQYQEAQKCLDAAIEWASKERASSLASQAYLERGICLLKVGRDQEGMVALEAARQQSAVLDKLHNLPIQARTRNQEAFLEIKKNAPSRALELLQHIRESLMELHVTHASMECLKFMGQAYTEMRDFVKAEKSLMEALAQCQELEMTQELAQVYRLLGLNAVQRASLEEAHYYLDESIEILQRLDMVSEIPLLYTQKGKLAMLQEDYREAERIFKEEMQASRRTANLHMLAFSHYHLGQLYRAQKRYLLGEKLLQEAMSLFKKVNNRRYQALTGIEVAMLYTDDNKAMRALDYLATAEPLLKEQQNPFLLAKFYLVKGGVLASVKGKSAEAKLWIKQALDIYEKQPQSTLELAEAYHTLARFHRNRQEMGQSITYYRKAINTSELLGFSQKTTRWLEELEELSPEDARKVRLQSLAGEQVVERMEKEGGSGMMRVSREELSIYFVDIRGFTSTTEKLSLDEMTSFLNDFYLNMSTVVIRNKGMINKFIGDNIMALYNVSKDLPDHAVWAVRTGVDMQSEIAKVNQRRARKGEVPINLGIGINTGEVLLGSFGSVLRQDFTAIGDAVNTAARLQSQAKPGEIIISETTYEKVKDQFVTEELGEVQVKGKQHAVKMYKVIGEKGGL